MPSQASVEFFIRFVQERYGVLLRATNDMLSIFAGEDRGAKKRVAELTLARANDLRSALSDQDVPGWLKQLVSYLGYYLQDSWTSADFLGHYIQIKPNIHEHAWNFNEQSSDAFDFDSIFERYKQQSRLGELFDEVVRILEGIRASEAVDSASMIHALGKVIATVRKSKDGSYLAVNSAWQFLRAFLQNYFWGELAKLPVLGSAFEALQKTIEETGKEMQRVHDSTALEMEQTVQAELKAFRGTSTFSVLSYNELGQIQDSSSNRPRLTTTTA